MSGGLFKGKRCTFPVKTGWPSRKTLTCVFNQLLLRPDIATVYYDYERDINYPERADRARLQYVQLDDSPELEALLTFVRFEQLCTKIEGMPRP